MQCDSVTKNLQVILGLLPFAQGILATFATFFIYNQDCLRCANKCLQHVLTLEAIKCFATLRNLFLFLIGPYEIMLGSPITVFQNISSSKVYFTSKLKGGQGIISRSHIEIKDHPAMQTVSGPCQLCTSPPMRVTVGFFCKSKRMLFSCSCTFDII